MSSARKVVILFTDTQPTRLVGAYGNTWADTPNLDRLAAGGMRFDRAYTNCPLCTPARGALFTGLQPASNGAMGNEFAPQRCFDLMGTVMRRFGWRAALTGKWHLDGAGYHGNGEVDGGFEPDWWYDGKRFVDAVGAERQRAIVGAIGGGIGVKDHVSPDMAAAMRAHDSAAALRELDLRDEEVWGHGVADRAIDFLEQVDDEPFVLVASFDEPHGPFVTPPAYQELFDVDSVPEPPNYRASLADKPRLQQIQAEEFPLPEWRDYCAWRLRHLRCNAYVDREMGRVIDAVHRLHGEDTLIIATSDHGDMMGSHGLLSKGAMMYEECARVPCIVQGPGVPAGSVCAAPVSLVDILPTLVELAGEAVPPLLHGRSLLPLLADPDARTNEAVLLQFNRFGVYHDGYGAWYPIRCAVDGRYKLAINLDDHDELYDLDQDPHELHNRIDDPALAAERDRLHRWLLAELDRTQDPLRGPRWAERPWSTVAWGPRFYGCEGKEHNHRRRGFAWDPNNPE